MNEDQNLSNQLIIQYEQTIISKNNIHSLFIINQDIIFLNINNIRINCLLYLIKKIIITQISNLQIIQKTKKMKSRCCKNFIQQLQQIQLLPQNQQHCQGAFLILDQITSKIISPLISLQQLFDHGIRSIQKVSVSKKKYLDACGIYYISQKSIQYVIKDFYDLSQKKQTKPTYFSINLMFCEPVSNQTMMQLYKYQSVIGRVAWFGQLYLNNIFLSQTIAVLNVNNYDNVMGIQEKKSLTKKQKEKQKQKHKEDNSKQRNKSVLPSFSNKTLKQKRQSSLMNIIFSYSSPNSKKLNQISKLASFLSKQLLISLISSFGSHIYLDVYYQTQNTSGSSTYSSPLCSLIVKQLQKEMKQHLNALQNQRKQKYIQKKLQKQKQEQQMKALHENQFQISSRNLKKKQKMSQMNQIMEMNDQQDLFQIIKLVIVDRKIDIISPAIHNFYYFPMMMDLLSQKYLKLQQENNPTHLKTQTEMFINSLKPKIFLKNNQKIQLKLEDPIFLKYKNVHINQAANTISKDLKSFTQQNKVAQFQKMSKNNQQDSSPQKQNRSITDTNTLTQVIRSLPQYNLKIASYKQNIDIIQNLLNSQKQNNLNEFGQIQHLIISKVNNKGQQVKDKKILAKVLPILDLQEDLNKNNTFMKNNQNKIRYLKTKIRIIFILICGVQMTDGDKQGLLKKLYYFVQKLQGYQLSTQQIQILRDLPQKISQYIGKVPIKLPSSPQGKKNVFLDKHQSKVASIFRSIFTSTPNNNKWQKQKDPSIKNIKMGNQQVIKNMLDIGSNKTRMKIRAMTAQINSKGNSQSNKGNNNIFDKKSQWVLFMPGGLSYNQMSNIQRVFIQCQNQQGDSTSSNNISTIKNRISYIVDQIYYPNQYLNAFAGLDFLSDKK